MKCLKYFLLVLSLLAVSLGTPLKATPKTPTGQETKHQKQTVEKTTNYSYNHTVLELAVDTSITKPTIIVEPCVFDTIRLAGRGQRYKGKRYYYTDKECFVVELKAKNKKTAPFDWIATLIKRFLKV